MSTDKIREEIEKIKTLASLQKDYLNIKGESSEKELELIKTKLAITREEMLKSTYSIGKLLTQIEEKV
jgi:hypothetical protein